ncbi:MAG: Crp/Fnr family transcriptional regulator [Clostridia bacterium]|nr:Crp/Fnr family transcriptional regulator [Clostridia bacterium]
MEQSLFCCILFQGLEEPLLSDALAFFDAKETGFHKGEQLIRMGDPWPAFGLVLEGVVSVCSLDAEGNRLIMANVSAGETFGESLSYLDVAESPIYADAGSDCRVLWLSTERLRTEEDSDVGNLLRRRFTTMLARRTLKLNDRIQVLSKKSLREKLMTFFAQQVRENGALFFEVPMDRNDMADYMGVDRSALSRELSRLKRDGVLDFKKNRFEILSRRHLSER